MTKRKLEQQVRYCLEYYPSTRNSDIDLMIHIWKQYYPNKVTGNSVALSDLYELPNHESIKRVRAHIQNDLHELVPTEWKIAKQRKFLEADWKRYLNYPDQAFMIADAEIKKTGKLFELGGFR